MPSLKAAGAAEFALHVIVLGDHKTAVDMPQHIQRSFRHLPGGFADSNQHSFSRSGTVIPQSALNSTVRLNGREGCPDDAVCIRTKRSIHERGSRGLFTTLMGAPATYDCRFCTEQSMMRCRASFGAQLM